MTSSDDWERINDRMTYIGEYLQIAREFAKRRQDKELKKVAGFMRGQLDKIDTALAEIAGDEVGQ